MVQIDKLSNKPYVYDEIIAYLLGEHYDMHKLLASLRNKRYLYSTFHALQASSDCYVVYSQEALIGLCVMLYDNIASIFIFPEHRHKGYAKYILEYIERQYGEVTLWTYNPKFISYYEKLGYSLKTIIQDSTVVTYTFHKRKAKL
jgi:GNAT superfamily N-acetyltransferase